MYACVFLLGSVLPFACRSFSTLLLSGLRARQADLIDPQSQWMNVGDPWRRV